MRRPLAPRALLVATVVGLVASRALSAQLPAATATLEEEFTRILSVRELSDGRVLVSDDRENRLVVVNLRSGDVKVIGRRGRGPAEFEQVGRLFAARGDTTLMLDQGNTRRWLLIARDSVLATIPPDDPAITTSGGSLHGADARGAVLSRRPRPLADLGGGRMRASSVVVRVDRATGRADTLAEARGIIIASGETRQGGNATAANFPLTFSVADQTVMFPDGWVAIARPDPYRVDWHPPAGAAVTGAPIPWTPVRVTEEEKRFWHDRTVEEAVSGRPYDYSGMPFAEEIPPFRSQGAYLAPDGHVVIHRERSRAAPGNDYDVIDRRGVRQRAIRLPPTERIVGFGAASVYVALRDDDGIERLRRHPWPAAPAAPAR